MEAYSLDVATAIALRLLQRPAPHSLTYIHTYAHILEN